MDIHDLSSNQFKRAATIKEQLASLNRELSSILGPNRSRPPTKNRRTVSVSARRKIAVAQRARWAKLRLVKGARRSTKPVTKKKIMSAAARAKLSAKMKRYWAAKKARRTNLVGQSFDALWR